MGLIIGAGAVLLVVTGLYLSEDIGHTDGIPDRSFDPLAWRMGDRRERGAMVEDLERKQLLIGASKGKVLELLGPPTASDTAGHALAYAVDLGLRTGPWGLGGTWLFQTTVLFDTLTGVAVEVRTND
jgi:hypothetical protein